MAEQENHFTVFIRLPFNRGDFVDPPPVAWSAAKERALWDIISRQSKGNEIDWRKLADNFEVTQPFLLQQAAWLYERQLSQVRAQMRRMGSRQSATASPAPSATASVVAAQPSKRTSISSRVPSRLSTHVGASVGVNDTSVPATPIRSRTSLPVRSASGAGSSYARGGSTSRPLSRKSSRENESSSRTHSRRGSVQNQITRSPIELEPPERSSSDEDTAAVSKTTHRRPASANAQRRPPSLRKSQHVRNASITHQQVDEETEEEDPPAFLPFTESLTKNQTAVSTGSDPSATLRDGLNQAPQIARPALKRNITSERVKPGMSTTVSPQPENPTASSTSSLSSSNNLPPRPLPRQSTMAAHRPPGNLPTPLSPRQQAALAAAAGLSPRRRSANTHQTGSESSPSMGSSFSDLDDASVTQSALEEALMSNMGSTAATMGGVGNTLGNRVSGISQALRSRYFDARSGNGSGVTESQR